jgi:hypothetical protein
VISYSCVWLDTEKSQKMEETVPAVMRVSGGYAVTGHGMD